MSIDYPAIATALVAVGTLIYGVIKDRLSRKDSQTDRDQEITSASLKRALDALGALADSLQKEVDRLMTQRTEMEGSFKEKEHGLITELSLARTEVNGLRMQLSAMPPFPPSTPAG